jgi:hypothetical protein
VDAFRACDGSIGLANLSETRDRQGYLQCFMRHGWLLCQKIKFRFAICAGNSVTNFKSNFAARFGCRRVGVAGKSGQFDFFRNWTATDGDRRAALRAALRPASLIHSFERP